MHSTPVVWGWLFILILKACLVLQACCHVSQDTRLEFDDDVLQISPQVIRATPSYILDRLILTGRPGLWKLLEENADRQENKDKFSILSVTWLPVTMHESDEYENHKQLKVLDVPDQDLMQFFEESVDFVAEELGRDDSTKVIVHCEYGISRSSSLVIAYLMKHQNMTLDQAFKHIKQRRPWIQPNAGFWAQLQRYEEKLGLLKDL